MSAEYPRSVLFKEFQNTALAQEAMRMSRAFADHRYLRWRALPVESGDLWHRELEEQTALRLLLDGALASRHPEERDQACLLAGQVEAFALRSSATESRVLKSPGGLDGYLIGLSSLVIDLAGNIAWVLPHPTHPEFDTILPTVGQALAEVIESYLRCDMTIRKGGKEAISPKSLLLAAHEDEESRPLAKDVWDAAALFSMIHELAHIERNHFDSAPGYRLPGFLRRKVRKLTPAEQLEVEADIWTFTSIANYYIWQWMMENDPSDDLHTSRSFDRAAARGVLRAAEATESFFTTMGILASYARLVGDDEQADRLGRVEARRPAVRLHMKFLRLFKLSEDYQLDLWQESDDTYRWMHDQVLKGARRDLPRLLSMEKSGWRRWRRRR